MTNYVYTTSRRNSLFSSFILSEVQCESKIPVHLAVRVHDYSVSSTEKSVCIRLSAGS